MHSSLCSQILTGIGTEDVESAAAAVVAVSPRTGVDWTVCCKGYKKMIR